MPPLVVTLVESGNKGAKCSEQAVLWGGVWSALLCDKTVSRYENTWTSDYFSYSRREV